MKSIINVKISDKEPRKVAEVERIPTLFDLATIRGIVNSKYEKRQEMSFIIEQA